MKILAAWLLRLNLNRAWVDSGLALSRQAELGAGFWS
jgi:hypothetical protein